jgi:antitoxin CptB
MDYNRLRWGCRRGMLELDLILLPFVENVYPNLPQAEQTLFQQLLECEDQDMFNWFLHRQQPEDIHIARAVAMVREHTGVQRPS